MHERSRKRNVDGVICKISLVADGEFHSPNLGGRSMAISNLYDLQGYDVVC